MPTNTPNLNLYKVNGETDGNDTFNVDVVLNDNWDKIDAAIKEVEDGLANIDVPDASLTQKGITQLSNATDGTRENVAATEKAVKDVKDSIPALNNTVTSTTITQAATANAVKQAYDRGTKGVDDAKAVSDRLASIEESRRWGAL